MPSSTSTHPASLTPRERAARHSTTTWAACSTDHDRVDRSAQQYFDQGLRLTYGFNHDEAVKSFKEGLKHDSTCAMCYWGIAYALGPNINLPMDTAAARPAYDAAQKALKYSASATPGERAYIEALAKRYSSDPAANRAPLDSAWANAIGEVSRRFPADDDAAALYGEALMDLRPWNYWTNGGRPKAPSTLEALRVLEPVVKRNPNHPGACHYYIHAIEASNEASKALACAERLGSTMPGAGHLVHMPTHIYIRLGQWDIAADRNVHAVHADEQYINERRPTGVYPMAYYPHNYHMMWYALNMLGRSEDALKAAQGVVKNVPADVVRQAPPLEYFSPTVLFTLARFSKWDDALREPAPPKDLRYTTRRLALRARARLHRAGQARLGRGGARQAGSHCEGDTSGRLRQPELGAVSAGHRGEPPAGRDGGKARQDGRGGQVPEHGDRRRGRADLRRAATLVPADPPAARRGAAGGRASGGGREGFPSRPGPPAGKRLVAAWSGAEPASPEARRGSVRGGGEVQESVVEGGCGDGWVGGAAGQRDSGTAGQRDSKMSPRATRGGRNSN